MEIKTRADLVQAIINNASTEEENEIIELLDEIATVEIDQTTYTHIWCDDTTAEIHTDMSPIFYYYDEEDEMQLCDSTSIQGTTLVENVYNVTPADATSIIDWRESNYIDVFNQALIATRHVVYKDNYNDSSYRTDMEKYKDLYDDDSTTSLYIEFQDSEDDYLQLQYAIARTTNNVRVELSNDIKGFFALSLNGLDWIYYGATTSNHDISNTSEYLTEYSSFNDAQTNYVNLVTGSNRLLLPRSTQMVYGRLYLYSDTPNNVEVIEYSWSEVVFFDDITAGTINTGFINIQSPDGRTTFDGNKIEVRDSNNILRVRLGRLN